MNQSDGSICDGCLSELAEAADDDAAVVHEAADDVVGVDGSDCPCVETGKPEIHLGIYRDAEYDLEQLDRLSHTDVSTKEGSVDLSMMGHAESCASEEVFPVRPPPEPPPLAFELDFELHFVQVLYWWCQIARWHYGGGFSPTAYTCAVVVA